MPLQSQNYLPTPTQPRTHKNTHTQDCLHYVSMKVIRDITHTYLKCLHVVSYTKRWGERDLCLSPTHRQTHTQTHTGIANCLIIITAIETAAWPLMSTSSSIDARGLLGRHRFYVRGFILILFNCICRKFLCLTSWLPSVCVSNSWTCFHLSFQVTGDYTARVGCVSYHITR